jgi:hypothetical protein
MNGCKRAHSTFLFTAGNFIHVLSGTLAMNKLSAVFFI